MSFKPPLSNIVTYTVLLMFCGVLVPLQSKAITLPQDTAGGLESAYLYISGQRIDTIPGQIVVAHHDGIGFEMRKADSLEYRFQLEGFEKNWSKWSGRSYKEYTNLDHGKYLFKYQFRKAGSEAVTDGQFRFRVRSPWYFSLVALITYPLLILILLLILRRRMHNLFKERQTRLEQLITERTEELQMEKDKSDRLLANMLPKGTAEEIMSKGKAAKTKYNFVTVLFSDIQGFTRIAEELNPEVLIDELDRFFFHFDSVVEKYRIEKIKTIGDAYMCAGGIPERNRTNPVEIVLAALEMQKYMLSMKSDPANTSAQFWDIRIGIHTGTVIAGVVGHKKITYDIWGDTVNTASRMESSGEAGKVNISGTTYEFVKDYFTCDYRGRMPVKYKGDLDMYFVTGIKPGLCDEDGMPNRKFFTKMEMIRILDVEDHVFTKYSENASPDLFFHNLEYIRSVCLHAELISKAENLEDDEYINLRLASVFLFFGYVFDYKDPVTASKKRAEEILSVYGFNTIDFEIISRLMENAFSPVQDTAAGRVLHDAVYDFCGRIDFITLIDKLFREEMAYGKVKDPESWFSQIEKRLIDNSFLTETAKTLRSVAGEDQAKALKTFAEEKLKHL